MLISVIIPAYNEAKGLKSCMEQTVNILKDLEFSYEIIVTDDGSTDESWNILQDLTKDYSALTAIRFSRNFGKEAAIIAGLTQAAGDAAIVMDADMQHPPKLLTEMIRLWKKENFLIVEGVKESRQKESWLRRIGAETFYSLFTKTSGIDIRHSTDFKLLDRIVIDQYLALPERGRFFRGLTAWLGFPKASVYFVPADRLESGSKWSIGSLVRLARRSLISFTNMPLRLITWFGLFTFIGSFVLGIQTLWNKFSGRAVDGFTTVILIQLALGSLIMFSLGLIGEYLARIFEEVKSRPLYVISDIEPKRSKKDEK